MDTPKLYRPLKTQILAGRRVFRLLGEVVPAMVDYPESTYAETLIRGSDGHDYVVTITRSPAEDRMSDS